MTFPALWRRLVGRPLESARFSLTAGSPAALNMGAAAVRTASRSLWGMGVPVVLSVAAYGTYSLLLTTAAVVSTVGILGTPQTLLRQPGRRLPIAGLFLHSLLIAAVVLPLLVVRAGVADRWYGRLVVVATVTLIGYGILVARAKAVNAFASVFRAEAVSGLMLLVALGGLVLTHRAHGAQEVHYTTVVRLEIAATLIIALWLLFAPATRLSRPELRLAGTVAILPSVYSVGVLVLLDLLIFRRLEMYFLEASPDGLQGVAVFGLGAQLASVVLLLPAAMVEAWMPSLATSFATAWPTFEAHLKTNRQTFRRAFALVALGGVFGPPLFVRFVFTRYQPWIWYVAAFAAIRVICNYAGFYSSALYVVRRERALYVAGVVGVVVGIAGNWWLTLRWGLRGAVVAFALTQGAVALASVFAFRAALPAMRRDAGTPSARLGSA